MKRKTGGEITDPGYGGAAHESSARGTDPAYELAADDFQRHVSDGDAARSRAGGDDTQGSLEIEFEDDSFPTPLPYPAGRSRDLRPAALTTLAAAVLGAALWATHGTAAAGPSLTMHFSTPTRPPNYAAFSVVVV